MKRRVPVVLSMMLAAGLCATPTMAVHAAPHFNPYREVQAEANFGAEGVEVVKEADGRTVVSSLEKNDYFLVKNINFSSGLESITITAKTDGMAVIDVRKGGVDGESLGNIKMRNTNGEYQTVTAKLKNLEGSDETIAFVGAVGDVSVDSWMATPKTSVTPDPEPTPEPDPTPIPDPDPIPDPEPTPDPDPIPTPDPTPTPDPAGKDLAYTINSWGTGYVVNFKLTNNTGSAINGWTVRIKKDQLNINSSWCMNVTEDGDYYVITPMSWNSTIANGGSIEFGIIGNGSIGSTINYSVE